jgi:hypothetical protein
MRRVLETRQVKRVLDRRKMRLGAARPDQLAVRSSERAGRQSSVPDEYLSIYARVKTRGLRWATIGNDYIQMVTTCSLAAIVHMNANGRCGLMMLMPVAHVAAAAGSTTRSADDLRLTAVGVG